MKLQTKDQTKKVLHEVIKSLEDHAEGLGSDHPFYKESQEDLIKLDAVFESLYVEESNAK